MAAGTASRLTSPGRATAPRLTNPGRPLWPEERLTKRDLADYFAAMAAPLLAHVAGRPLGLLRAPAGIGGETFFQRHPSPGLPRLLRRVAIPGEAKPCLMVDSPEGLLALAQIAAIELHPWGAPAEDVERPDRLVFDLDPGPEVAWARTVAAAREMRDRLDRHGLAGFCKTTGGKGLHVVVPLVPKAGWAEAHDFARDLCAAMEADAPAAFTTAMRKAGREGRIFLDYLRNERGASAVAPFSPRARPGATVSMPLAWEEVAPALDPRAFTLRSAPARLRGGTDPWAGFAAAAVPLPRARPG